MSISALVLIVTLLALGMVAAAKKMEELMPPSKKLVDFLKQSEGWIGLVSIFIGLFWLIRFLKYFHLSGYALIALVSALLLIILGLLCAQNTLRDLFGESNSVTKGINKAVDIFAPHKVTLGLAAIILAIIDLVIYI